MVTGTPSMTIGEVSTLYNVTLRALRFYEDRGLLTPTRIGTTRIYYPKDAVRLQLILKGKQFGFSLEEIRALIDLSVKVDRSPTKIADKIPTDMVLARMLRLEKERDDLIMAIQELKDALYKKTA